MGTGEAMTYSFELVLLALVLATAGMAIVVKDLISAVFVLGSYSFFMALVWAWMGAVDVAFIEAVVGAGLATVFFLLVLFQMPQKDTIIKRTPTPKMALFALPPLGLLLFYATTDLPEFGDPGSPASSHISPFYLENTVKDTLTPNAVTSIIMDYRSLDTLIETLVIFTAGVACAAVLRRKET
jgi:multicomponent Na+:H+ antiporter subunit B